MKGKMNSIRRTGRSIDKKALVKKLTVMAMACFTLLGSCARPQAGEKDPLKQEALMAFDRYKEVWDFNDFWKRGNTFDACLVFADAANQKWPDDPEVMAMQKTVNEMLKEQLVFFKRFDPGTLWADDFGWWGLMGLNAYKHLSRTGEPELAQQYLNLATELCWEYKRKTAYDDSEEGFPVVHGCRNGDANGESMGVKNTVTNSLLFLLSSRIYRLSQTVDIPDSEKYLDMAYRQWVWFDEWFRLNQYEYLKPTDHKGALVQERPMCFDEGSTYTEEIHPPWAEGWVWTGDQGLVIGALADMYYIRKDLAAWLSESKQEGVFNADEFGTQVQGLIQTIARGIQTALVYEGDQVFREAPCYSSMGPNHGNDYLAGRGIMMRYLGAEDIKPLLGVDFKANVEATVKAIWDTRDQSTNQFQPVFTTQANDEQYIQYFKGVWGLADDIMEWDIKQMKEQNKHGVCQSIGLDAIGVAIKNLK